MSKIVIFFSYTNHTRTIAEKVSDFLNCDILEIKPKIPYADYNTVVEDENNGEYSNYLPEIEDLNVNLDDYSEIILGTPVWWYRPVPAIRTFLTQNDLSDKTIYPFATNAGWLGKTFEEIKELCPNSKVKKELSIKFTENHEDNQLNMSEKIIDQWLETL